MPNFSLHNSFHSSFELASVFVFHERQVEMCGMMSDRIAGDGDAGSLGWLQEEGGGNNNNGAIGRCLE